MWMLDIVLTLWVMVLAIAIMQLKQQHDRTIENLRDDIRRLDGLVRVGVRSTTKTGFHWDILTGDRIETIPVNEAVGHIWSLLKLKLNKTAAIAPSVFVISEDPQRVFQYQGGADGDAQTEL